jgi:hypothetical protein
MVLLVVGQIGDQYGSAWFCAVISGSSFLWRYRLLLFRQLKKNIHFTWRGFRAVTRSKATVITSLDHCLPPL